MLEDPFNNSQGDRQQGIIMIDKNLSNELWRISNIITGFAVVQSIALIYACAKPDFAALINTLLVKISIAFFIIIYAGAQCYAIRWCADKMVALLTNGRQTGGTEDVNHNMIVSITKKAARARIILILSLLAPVLLSLFARQLGGMPFNSKVPNAVMQMDTRASRP